MANLIGRINNMFFKWIFWNLEITETRMENLSKSTLLAIIGLCNNEIKNHIKTMNIVNEYFDTLIMIDRGTK